MKLKRITHILSLIPLLILICSISYSDAPENLIKNGGFEEKMEELPNFDREMGLYSIRTYLQAAGNMRTVIEIGNGAHLLADQNISINSNTMEDIKETSSAGGTSAGNVATVNAPLGKGKMIRREKPVSADANNCLLYTSDAADE